MLRKKRNRKNSLSLKQFSVLIAFFSLLGANQRGPVEPILDRFAMGPPRFQCIHSNRVNAPSYPHRNGIKRMLGQSVAYKITIRTINVTRKKFSALSRHTTRWSL